MASVMHKSDLPRGAAVAHRPDHLLQNSSFLRHNSSFLIQNSSFLLTRIASARNLGPLVKSERNERGLARRVKSATENGRRAGGGSVSWMSIRQAGTVKTSENSSSASEVCLEIKLWWGGGSACVDVQTTEATIHGNLVAPKSSFSKGRFFIFSGRFFIFDTKRT